jgi:hypothetical protein
VLLVVTVRTPEVQAGPKFTVQLLALLDPMEASPVMDQVYVAVPGTTEIENEAEVFGQL